MTIPTAAIRVVVFAGALLGVAGCASLPAYENVPAGQPAAALRVLKSYGDAGLFGSGLQGYALSTDETCKTTRDGASFTWTTGDEKEFRVVPDQPILVWAITTYYQGNSSKTCRSVVRFTPQRDHAYDVSQPTTTASPGCGVTVVDRATGVPAPDVVFVRSSPCVEEDKAAKG